jgi:hypothetical protein
MDAILETLSHGAEQLLGRASGPLHLRLVIMPIVVTILAIRAGGRDAREERPVLMGELLTSPAGRRRLLRSGLMDIGRIFIVAIVLDTAYQLIALRAFYVVQALIVAVACAIVPYVLFRGLTTRLARALSERRYGESHVLATDTSDGEEGHEASQDRSNE